MAIVPAANQVVGSYRLERRLGRGGMGEVWVGRHVVSGSLAAIKMFRHRKLVADPHHTFETECRAVARLSHPNIVGVHEIGEQHLALRFIGGVTLARRMREPLSLRAAWDLCRQIASALSHAHQQGVIHRDVKPANILLDRMGTAFLADFGIAIVADSERDEVAAGSPGYMSPEQERREPLTTATDQYSLALTVI